MSSTLSKIEFTETLTTSEHILSIKPYTFDCPRCNKTIENFGTISVSSPGGYKMCIQCYNEMIDAQFKEWVNKK